MKRTKFGFKGNSTRVHGTHAKYEIIPFRGTRAKPQSHSVFAHVHATAPHPKLLIGMHPDDRANVNWKHIGQAKTHDAAMKLVEAHHAKLTSKKSMQYTTQGEKMSKELESFEEIFKSDGDEAHCPTCGGEVEFVEKGGKKKMKARGVAKKIGNEMDPHKGGKTGTFVDHKRPGSLGSAVDRDHAKKPHAPRSGVVKSEGGEALFPQATTPFRLVQYTGLGEDAALAKQIEDSQDPQKAHSLYTPSMRNLAVENEGGE